MVIPFVVGMFLAPETPHWYYAQGREEEGLRSLEWIHGTSDRAFLARDQSGALQRSGDGKQ